MLYLISCTEGNSFDFIANSVALYPILMFFPITFEWQNGHRQEHKSSHFSSECFKNVLRHKFSKNCEPTLLLHQTLKSYRNALSMKQKLFPTILFSAQVQDLMEQQTSLLIIIIVTKGVLTSLRENWVSS